VRKSHSRMPLTKTHGLSLADRACLALAKRLDIPIVTADRDWADLNLGITLQLIR
jgi:ribonuclease VapC